MVIKKLFRNGEISLEGGKNAFIIMGKATSIRSWVGIHSSYNYVNHSDASTT